MKKALSIALVSVMFLMTTACNPEVTALSAVESAVAVLLATDHNIPADDVLALNEFTADVPCATTVLASQESALTIAAGVVKCFQNIQWPTNAEDASIISAVITAFDDFIAPYVSASGIQLAYHKLGKATLDKVASRKLSLPLSKKDVSDLAKIVRQNTANKLALAQL